jgi:hypothetical protein
MLFIWVIGKVQRQVYESTVQNSVKPDLVEGIRRYDSSGLIKQVASDLSPKLADLSVEYTKSSDHNAPIHNALMLVGVLMILFLLIPGWLLYQNGVRFGVKEILWRALGFYLLLLIFGVYFFVRAVSSYAPFTFSQLIKKVANIAIRNLEMR